MKELNNFKMWYEYDILQIPPKLLGLKYGINESRIMNMARKKRDSYEFYIVPDSWGCVRRWNKELDGIDYPFKGDYNGIQ